VSSPTSSWSTRWRHAKRWPGWLALAVVAVVLLAVGANQDNTPTTREERIEAISKRLACPICDGESVFESRNNASVAIRNEIAAQVDGGVRSDEEIITFIEQRYGSRVLLVPRATGLDALVWALPVAAFVCATAGLTVAFRRWKRAGDTVPTDEDRVLVATALRDERVGDRGDVSTAADGATGDDRS
jgi:cytochrome c-type biogenesis protein CcmH